MSPRPRSVSDRDIFSAIEAVISRVGPADLTIALVAKEAGLAPSSLVQRFGTRRGLLLAFASQAPEGAAAVFARARESERDAVSAIRAGFRAMSAPVRTRRRLANHLAFLQIDLNDPEFRTLARHHGEALREELARLVAEARAAGLIESSNARETAVALQVAYNGALVTWAIHGEGSLDRFIDRALDRVLR